MELQLDALGKRRRFQTWLLSSFSAIALILAAIGIYGLISYSVTERTPEIGIRMALGARPLDIMSMILGSAFHVSRCRPAARSGARPGSFAGCLLLAFRSASTDSLTLTLATLLLLMVALAAGYFRPNAPRGWIQPSPFPLNREPSLASASSWPLSGRRFAWNTFSKLGCAGQRPAHRLGQRSPEWEKTFQMDLCERNRLCPAQPSTRSPRNVTAGQSVSSVLFWSSPRSRHAVAYSPHRRRRKCRR